MTTPMQTITVDADAAFEGIVRLIMALLPNDAAIVADTFERVAKGLRQQALAAAIVVDGGPNPAKAKPAKKRTRRG